MYTNAFMEPAIVKSLTRNRQYRPEGSIEYHRQVVSARVRHPRDIIVWLPPSYYQDRRKRYPVLYMHDGQNLMDPSTAFLGVDWRVNSAAARLIEKKRIRELLIVGIYNTQDREEEYTSSIPGLNYANFVIHDVKPLIDRTYRTKPDADHTGVMGSSLGGLISFLFAWWHPDVFGKAGCMSNSFFWDDYSAVKVVDRYEGPKKHIRLYLDVGSKEVFLRSGYERMVPLLRRKGFRKGVDLQYHIAKGGSHDEKSWGERVWRPLTFLFPYSSRR